MAKGHDSDPTALGLKRTSDAAQLLLDHIVYAGCFRPLPAIRTRSSEWPLEALSRHSLNLIQGRPAAVISMKVGKQPPFLCQDRKETAMNRRFAIKTVAALSIAALASACAPMMDDGDDIVDIAASNEDFSTLVTAVEAAGLVGTLKGAGPFTVFAPTNAAFAKLPAGTVESLLLPENKDQLVSILTYHVIPGAVTSDQLAGQRTSVATVQGSDVHIDGTNGVRVENANVIGADIIATNGVIHVIDNVLLP